MTEERDIKRIVEALLFALEGPLTLDDFSQAIHNVENKEIRRAIDALKEEYTAERRSYTVRRIAGGYQLVTLPQYAEYIRQLRDNTRTTTLSKAALETLAIIAYRQPATKAQIEEIRGVASDGVIRNLLEKKLIRIAGRKKVMGRPLMYGTTSRFLDYFGLDNINELPKLEDFELPEG
jgi:segregation and condensation protein B